MNPCAQTIGWADKTWNPVTGCWGPGGTAERPNRCPYCYAHKLACGRLRGRVGYPADDPFRPTFHPGRLGEPLRVKKPARIFVCSMGDLFAPGIPNAWLFPVLETVLDAPQHTYIFLTQHPETYQDLNDWKPFHVGSWPPNCWLGATVVRPEDLAPRVEALSRANARVRFLSLEPLLDITGMTAAVYHTTSSLPFDWVILGGLTGGRYKWPEPAQMRELIGTVRAFGALVYCKENTGFPGPREFPKEDQR